MNLQNKILLTLLYILFMIPITSASLLITIESDHGNNPSLNLNHGKSEIINFKITNPNSFCSIQCNWNLLKQEIGISTGTQTIQAGYLLNLPITFIAPTKEEAVNNYGKNGAIGYTLGVDCSELGSYICTSKAPIATIYITLNYDLTTQEKEAEAYLQPNLNTISNLLKNIESKLFNLNTKINNLPKNMLLSDIETDLSNYDVSYKNHKSSYNYINNLYSELKFIEAKNAFSPNQITNLQDIESNLNSLEQGIEERLKRHNEIIERLNNANIKFEELKKKSLLTNKDISYISDELDNIKIKFDGGLFESYDSIENEVLLIVDKIEAEITSFDKEVNTIIKDGEKLLSIEKKKLQKEDSYLKTYNNLNDLISICNEFSSIKKDFELINKKTFGTYNKDKYEIEAYNSNIETINSKISEVNSISKEIRNLINKNDIKEFDYSSCQEELDKISKLSYDELINLNNDLYKNCIELQGKLLEIKKQKENSLWFKISSFFRGLWFFGRVKFAQTELLKQKELPEEPNILYLEEQSEEFGTNYCNINLTIKADNSFDYVENVEGDTLTKSEVGEVVEKENLCSSFGITDKCCEGDECANDINSYPIIFLHGHSFYEWYSPEYSLDAFNNIQLSLFQDKYRIGGVFLPTDAYSNMIKGEWGRVKFPITVKATYYYNVYNSEGKLINAHSKQESISTYAQRLSKIVDLVKYRTGRNKVVIIAHSMGGLVARDYIKNYGGDSSVYKLIMIGTPNDGVFGIVANGCNNIFTNPGADLECAEMKEGSTFLSNLNSGDETYGNIKYYTIAGTSCEVIKNIEGSSQKIQSDGVVSVNSVQLEGAINVEIKGKCEGWHGLDFHSNLLDPNKYPKTLEYIKQFLKEQ